MLKIEQLVKKYGRFCAVNNLNLEIGDGKIFGFVGPNGAGKTTTMKIMAGLMSPTSGRITINELDATGNADMLKQKIGYMPDFFGVYDNLKVTEYLDFYEDAYYIPISEKKELTKKLLELVNLTEKSDFYVDSLSRGMKQRLCLARSLVHDPDILILDEPASGLDPRARLEMKDILRQLREMGKTVVISSHILPELAQMCDEIGIINRGEIVVQGSVDEITAKMSNGRKIMVKTIEANAELITFLRQMPLVRDINDNNDAVRFIFDGDEQQLSVLLAKTVQTGMPVVSFGETEGDLEDIFMTYTGGEKDEKSGVDERNKDDVSFG